MRVLNFIILFCVVLILSYFVPKIYDTITEPANESNYVYFSPLTKDFIITSHKTKPLTHSYYDRANDKNITSDEYMANLPFLFYTYLIANDKFPSFFEKYKNASLISENSQSLEIKSTALQGNPPPLNLLFESNPKSLNNYLVDIKNGFEFIDLIKNQKDSEISNLFENEMRNNGVKFPLISFFSNANFKKMFDWGAFVIDSEEQIFHIKMINGKPFVKNTNIELKNVLKIAVAENKRKEFLAAIIKEDGIYLVNYDDYKIKKIPNNGYDYKKDDFELKIDPLYKIASYENDEKIDTIVMDYDYNIIKKHSLTIPKNTKFEEIKNYIFPFWTDLKIKNNSLRINLNEFSFKSLFMNLVIVVLAFFIFKIRKFEEFILLILGGIFTFFAMILFKNLRCKAVSK